MDSPLLFTQKIILIWQAKTVLSDMLDARDTTR